jgi:ribonucleotide reductase beta subunit family protein with ferritin-like domain
MLTKKAPADDITRIVKDAVSTEKAYILEGFDVSAIGMVPSEMAAHIEWAADNLMKTLELPALFGTTNPYESWLEVAASPLASASSASLAQTKSVVMENPGDSVLSFGMDDDDF